MLCSTASILRSRRAFVGASLPCLILTLVACAGRTRRPAPDPAGAELRLDAVAYGRLVDVLAWRRQDPGRSDRRDVLHRVPTLVARDVPIDPELETSSLFSATGFENPYADFAVPPHDGSAAHDRLLILWDDQHPDERARFAAALQRARDGLVPVAAAHAGQNPATQPMPVVPRQAAIVLRFTAALPVDDAGLAANPAAVQLLEIVDDPQVAPTARALRPLPVRTLVRGDCIVLDPSPSAGEAGVGSRHADGLPPSTDDHAANVRIALPLKLPGGSLGVRPDRNEAQNGHDREGRAAVIRDFRAANAADRGHGHLSDAEAPMLVADVLMGISHVDADQRVLTLDKRGARVAVRGRIPFVDGPLDPLGTLLPMGPHETPTIVPLRCGDIVSQTVQTRDGPVLVHAEVLMVLDVANEGPWDRHPELGLAADDSDGGDADSVRVRVAALSTTTADGITASFVGDPQGRGADCAVRVHYYENVPYRNGQASVSDAARRARFVTFDPPPVDAPPGTRIDPHAALRLHLSEPVDLTTVASTDNVVLTNALLPGRASGGGSSADAADLLQDAKVAALSMLVSTITADDARTTLRLEPALGHTHLGSERERYWLHVLLGQSSLTDVAGNALTLYDERPEADRARSFSMAYELDPDAPPNLVGSRVVRFASSDEDGTKPGSPDFFGQFELRDGSLFAAPVTRMRKAAEHAHLQTIQRGLHGECFDPGDPAVPRSASHVAWGPLYTTTTMLQQSPSLPNPFPPTPPPYYYGGVLGPQNPRGSREMTTYREDDFGLGYHDPDGMLVDVEQLHWAPWRGGPVLFDVFDRCTLRLGHARKRPDLRVAGSGGSCDLECSSLFSGLSPVFDDNPLAKVMVEVARDATYTIDPQEAFRSDAGTVLAPSVKFERTFTWRDSRLVSWDRASSRPLGLGGADDPSAQTIPPQDTTKSVSSPWEQDEFPIGRLPPQPIPTAAGYVVTDPGDFLGDRRHDLDPIALPLLVEWSFWPDDRNSNGPVRGSNRMQIGFVGINLHQSRYWGYFNRGRVPPPGGSPVPHWAKQRAGALPDCRDLPYPTFTVFSGGFADRNGVDHFVDPTQEMRARGSTIFDISANDTTTGLEPVGGENDHLYWAQADFVRRVSMVTFGFFDTLRPNQHDLAREDLTVDWPGLATPAGVPDLAAPGTRRIVDLVAVMDPPLEQQPAGTKTVLELRGAESIANAERPWNRLANDRATARNGQPARFNLLNPSYACEAYRYAQAPVRVAAEGLTPYADVEHIDELRTPGTGLLPRYLNFRIVLEADLAGARTPRPSLNAVGLAYRVVEPE
ncbi:MAG: hypothetical protein R3F56_11260 [Planctomycetota bacterium]